MGAGIIRKRTGECHSKKALEASLKCKEPARGQRAFWAGTFYSGEKTISLMCILKISITGPF